LYFATVSENLPHWLPEEVRNEEIRRRASNRDRFENGRIFFRPLFIDERMKVVWKKIFKINSDSTVKLMLSLEKMHMLYKQDAEEFLDPYKAKQKRLAIEASLAACKQLLSTTNSVYKAYTFDLPFEKNNNPIFDRIMYDSEYDNFKNGVKKYIKRLEEILFYYEVFEERLDELAYLQNPISRKKSVHNSEAILWAKKLKAHFLESYKKPLHQEIGTIISILFDDNPNWGDSNYVAKITQDVGTTFKKLEDSL
jgi:hypothetical protein